MCRKIACLMVLSLLVCSVTTYTAQYTPAYYAIEDVAEDIAEVILRDPQAERLAEKIYEKYFETETRFTLSPGLGYGIGGLSVNLFSIAKVNKLNQPTFSLDFGFIRGNVTWYFTPRKARVGKFVKEAVREEVEDLVYGLSLYNKDLDAQELRTEALNAIDASWWQNLRRGVEKRIEDRGRGVTYFSLGLELYFLTTYHYSYYYGYYYETESFIVPYLHIGTLIPLGENIYLDLALGAPTWLMIGVDIVF